MNRRSEYGTAGGQLVHNGVTAEDRSRISGDGVEIPVDLSDGRYGLHREDRRGIIGGQARDRPQVLRECAGHRLGITFHEYRRGAGARRPAEVADRSGEQIDPLTPIDLGRDQDFGAAGAWVSTRELAPYLSTTSCPPYTMAKSASSMITSAAA